MWNDSSRYLAWSVVLALAALGCSNSSPTEPTPAPCTYTLSASSLSFEASGGSNSVTVSAASHCTWTATSDRGWMSVTGGASGSGGGTVNITVSSNPTNAVRTETDSPAMVNVPVRTALVGFEETVMLTVPAPLPLAPPVTDIQPLSDVAVHVQWLAALTVTELDPPDASNDRDEAESV